MSKLCNILMIFLLILTALTNIHAQANTIVIASDTTFSGTIEISDNIVVSNGATLTINPGTSIYIKRTTKFSPSIRVEGRLKAIGTQEKIILFSGITERPSGWEGIYFFENTDSELRYCKILFANTSITCEKSSMIIANCTIAYNEKGLESTRESQLVVQENIFKNNLFGIDCKSGSTALIIKNSFEESKEYAITYSEGSSPTILENNFNKNNMGIYTANAQSAPYISFNNFNENQYGIMFRQFSGAQINNSVFQKNKYGIYGQMMSNSYLSNCIFNKNTIALSGKIVSAFKILNSDISENQIGFNLQIGSVAIINYCNIINNDIGINISLSSAEADNNNIDNIQYNAKISMVSEESQKRREIGNIKALNFKYNWWGDRTTKEIKNRIYNLSTFWDYYDYPIGFDRGTIFHMDKILYDSYMLQKNENCGVDKNEKDKAIALNLEIIQKQLWRLNPNELRGKTEKLYKKE
ncbi:right-handed parallel beta-helix repeat-containing protein [Candidatus Poribacteria bacterium]|nr:right-handed parallel beta-helix repeat-containing protein [Candidatus Poribacteria bacterium]